MSTWQDPPVVGFDDRAELLAAAPDVYYVTDHYLNYNPVLVRLSRLTPDVLRDLLGMAHKFVTAHAGRSGDRESGFRDRNPDLQQLSGPPDCGASIR